MPFIIRLWKFQQVCEDWIELCRCIAIYLEEFECDKYAERVDLPDVEVHVGTHTREKHSHK